MFMIKGKGRAEISLGFDDFFFEIIFKVFLFGALDVFRYENKISMRCFGCLISNKKIEKTSKPFKKKKPLYVQKG